MFTKIVYKKIKLPIANCHFLNSRGVTLLELMVSITLFSITILMATQIFKSVIDGQRTAIASQEMQESVRYAFERMGKEIRTAVKDSSGACNAAPGKIYRADAGGEGITFLNYKNKCIHYYVIGQRLAIQRNAEPVQYITPNNLLITKPRFVVTDNSDTTQAKVLMRFQMEILVKNRGKQKLNVETVISSRFYE
jgi:prepilin-type N-terminal cleavage/methylation domain-containing protein